MLWPELPVGRPEIFTPGPNTWASMPSADYITPSYPFLFQIPDGRIISAGAYEGAIDTRVLNLSTGTWSVLDSNVIDAGSAVMYAPGKIMKAGKWANADPPFVAAHANTYVLDVNQPSPQWRSTAPMAFPRAYNMLTLLPDGTTLATGGSRSTDPGNAGQGVLEAELWSPQTETWITLARMQNQRIYHGTSILLPDGRVIVAGSGRYGSPEEFNAEIYSPPYLFKGARPAIGGVPALVAPGRPFVVNTTDTNVTRVTMLRIGAMTHSFNSDQRFLDLPFTVEPGQLRVTAPANVYTMPPGYYMLFLINGSGVPSICLVGASASDTRRTFSRRARHPNLSACQAASVQASLNLDRRDRQRRGHATIPVHRSTASRIHAGPCELQGQPTASTSYVDAVLSAPEPITTACSRLRRRRQREGPASNEASATVTSDGQAPTGDPSPHRRRGASVSGHGHGQRHGRR